MRPEPIQHHEQLFLHRCGELARNGFFCMDEKCLWAGRFLVFHGPLWVPALISPSFPLPQLLGPGILASSLDVDILTVPSPVLVLQKFLPLSFYLTQEKTAHFSKDLLLFG